MTLRLAWDGSEKREPAGGGSARLGSLPASAEQLCAALEGREVTLGHQTWVVETYGVWDTQGQRWVQLSLQGRDGLPNYTLTIKLDADAGLHHALMALSSWLANPDARETLSVA